MSAAATLIEPWRGLSRTVWVLVVARAVNRIGAFSLSFLAIVLTVEFGASLSRTGLVVALFGLATIPSRLLGGVLADRLGRRRTIVLGLAGCAGAQLWIAASTTLWSAMAAAIVLGLAFEIYEPSSQAAVADATAPADRPAAYGLLGSAMAVAGVLAGLLAAAVSHWDLRWLFVADAITCLACAVLVAFALPVDVRRDWAQAGGVTVWRDRRLLLLLASGTVFATIYMQLVVGIPLTLMEQKLSASGTGIILAVSAVVMIVAQRLLRVQLDDFRAMNIGCLLLATGLMICAFATTLPVFLLAAAFWSVGEALLLTRYLTQAAGLAPDGGRARYLAVFGLCWGAATTVAPLIVTYLLATSGPKGLWLTNAAAAVALAAAQPWLRRRLAPA
ncbi:MFS transporter [Streptomyces sp. NBC_00193]|uniref:MFS transporter n=1 Tax=unclassified Streptomyces TaxID=2593676 RepID=UPI002252EB61|nr:MULTISPECIES: MFS transporter [unclassified Streptomyces]MCX5123303.1 MFS transporter [Streptomyces sp. NBC_00347]MCX5296648.1 MFS transporter [Streptomyces sp. NBC_00193]